MNAKYVTEGLEHCRIGDCVGCPYDETRKQSLVCDKRLTWQLACNEQLTEDILELLKENQRQQECCCSKCSMRDKTKMCHKWYRNVKDDDYCSYYNG